MNKDQETRRAVRLSVIIIVVLILAWGFLGCAAAKKGIEDATQPLVEHGTQTFWGTLIGAVVSIAVPASNVVKAILGALAAAVTTIFSTKPSSGGPGGGGGGGEKTVYVHGVFWWIGVGVCIWLFIKYLVIPRSAQNFWKGLWGMIVKRGQRLASFRKLISASGVVHTSKDTAAVARGDKVAVDPKKEKSS